MHQVVGVDDALADLIGVEHLKQILGLLFVAEFHHIAPRWKALGQNGLGNGMGR